MPLIYKGLLCINVEMDLANTWLRKCAKKMKRQFTEEKINSVRESSSMGISQTPSTQTIRNCCVSEKTLELGYLSFRSPSNSHRLSNWASKLTFLYSSLLISERAVTAVTHKIALNISWVLPYMNHLEKLGGYSNCEKLRNGFLFLFSVYVVVSCL